MKTFLKAQLSSLLASAADFAVTILLVEMLLLNYTAATLAGAVSGAIVNFMINKHWSFAQGKERTTNQAGKYALVWIGSIALNAAGSTLMIRCFNASYVLSKIAVSVIVGITFNYTLQKYYVFSKAKRSFQE